MKKGSLYAGGALLVNSNDNNKLSKRSRAVKAFKQKGSRQKETHREKTKNHDIWPFRSSQDKPNTYENQEFPNLFAPVRLYSSRG
mmetsp:Transcript_4476/g.6792  ORF Transcript_4476/g.6792 Transcript_4476/m.6792 type:complete len:85 (+) Transcript_4476:271-525(+)